MTLKKVPDNGPYFQIPAEYAPETHDLHTYQTHGVRNHLGEPIVLLELRNEKGELRILTEVPPDAIVDMAAGMILPTIEIIRQEIVLTPYQTLQLILEQIEQAVRQRLPQLGPQGEE